MANIGKLIKVAFKDFNHEGHEGHEEKQKIFVLLIKENQKSFLKHFVSFVPFVVNFPKGSRKNKFTFWRPDLRQIWS